MRTPIYAIGDIHGQAADLDRVLDLIDRDGGPEAPVVFLGDYTDRGPDSRAVIDRLIGGRDAGRNWTFLKGNHDRMFEWFLEDVPRHDPYLLVGYHWLHERLGGLTTLASYGVTFPDRTRLIDVHAETRAAVPPAHGAFLRDCTLCHQHDDLFFVHAGIRPHVPLDQQTEQDLLWIRQEFHTSDTRHPALIVHGHTPVEHATHYGNRVNLDSGAGYGRPISAAVFDAEGDWLLTATGRQALIP